MLNRQSNVYLIFLFVLQAPKKAKKKIEGGSNVFSMFEQTQIQEFKEVGYCSAVLYSLLALLTNNIGFVCNSYSILHLL